MSARPGAAAPPAPAARRGRGAAALDLALVVGLELVACALFVPAFGPAVGAGAAAGGVCAGAVVGAVGRRRRLSALPVLALAAVVHLGVAPWVLPDTGRGAGAVRAVLRATVTVWRDALTLPLPLSAFPTMSVLPWLTGLAGAALAVRALLDGRVHAAGLAVVGQALVALAWGAPAALAPRAIGAGLTCGVLLLWALASQRGRRSRVAEVLAGSDAGLRRGARLGAVRAVAVLAAAGTAAAALTPAGAQDRVVLRTLLAPPVDLTQYATPLSLVRALETEFASTTLMTVSGVGEDGRVRIAALDAYDGLSARIDQGDSSRFQRVGADTPLTGAGTHSPQAREVVMRLRDYGFAWVPTVSDALSIAVSGPRAEIVSDSLHYDMSSATGIATAGLTGGDVLTEQVVVPSVPSDADLALLGTGSPRLGAVVNVPPSVEAMARSIVDTTSEPVAQIRLLQQALRAGYYSDGTTSSSPPGHGTARMAQMVEAGELVGDDEQYSVLMMLLCRSLGIPARVVMGFKPATDGDASTVTGQDISAWVEVDFRQAGWVAVDVTPDRDHVPQQQNTQKVSNPEPRVLQPPLPLQHPAELPPAYDDGHGNSPDDRDAGVDLRLVLAVVGGLLALVAPVVTILALKALRRRRRARGSGPDRAAGAWDEVVDRARDLGSAPPARATRREEAEVLAPGFPTADLRRFARAVDAQIFGAGEPSPSAVDGLWESADAMMRAMSTGRSAPRRLIARLSTHSLRRLPRQRTARRFRRRLVRGGRTRRRNP